MSSELVITFQNVCKKYSKLQVLNNSLKDEIVSVITGKKCRDELAEGEFSGRLAISVLKWKKGSALGLPGITAPGKDHPQVDFERHLFYAGHDQGEGEGCTADRAWRWYASRLDRHRKYLHERWGCQYAS